MKFFDAAIAMFLVEMVTYTYCTLYIADMYLADTF